MELRFGFADVGTAAGELEGMPRPTAASMAGRGAGVSRRVSNVPGGFADEEVEAVDRLALLLVVFRKLALQGEELGAGLVDIEIGGEAGWRGG